VHQEWKNESVNTKGGLSY